MKILLLYPGPLVLNVARINTKPPEAKQSIYPSSVSCNFVLGFSSISEKTVVAN